MESDRLGSETVFECVSCGEQLLEADLKFDADYGVLGHYVPRGDGLDDFCAPIKVAEANTDGD